jgi:hypothetical protein
MTEAQWLECSDPTRMLDFLRGKVSDRKLRLFAVACCRRIWHLLTDERSRRLIEASEAYADQRIRFLEVGDAYRLHDAAERGYEFPALFFAACYAADCGIRAAISTAHEVADAAGFSVSTGIDDDETVAANHAVFSHAERVAQTTILRDVCNPFRPVTIGPLRLTPTVVTLAQSIYQERSFDSLPILAGALEEAGCTDADILGHCRQPGQHVRGCWAVDLLLGKE